jgi:predicted O-methyltransferase YrrM
MRWPVLARAALVGLALSVTLFGGGALVLFNADGLLPAMAGMIATFAVALAAGLWAGVPAPGKEPALHGRWLFAGLSVGAAGVYATALEILTAIGRPGGMRALGLLFLVALPAYAVGLLFPPLLAWAEEFEEGEWTGARPIGTLVLGFLAGFAVGALVAGLVLVPHVDAGPLLLGNAALLTSPVFLPWGPPAGPEEQVLHEAETPFGTLRVVEVVYPGDRQPERLLCLDDETESGELARTGAPTLAYVAAAERWLAEVSSRGDAYLFLGGGAYTLPRRVAERDPSARITVVERDPESTRVACRFFGLRPEHGIVPVHGDARAVVEDWGEGEFDRVFVDVYDGRESLPYSLVTVEALSVLRRLLRPGGVGAMNVIGVGGGAGEKRLWSVVRTAAAVFPSVALYVHLGRDYPERQNFLLAFSPDPAHRFPARAGAFDLWPRDEWPGWEGTLVFRDRLDG